MPKSQSRPKPIAEPSLTSDGPIEDLIHRMRQVVESPAAGREALAQIRESYRKLGPGDKPILFKRLLEVIEIKPEEVAPLLAEAAEAAADPEKWSLAVANLRTKISSPRERLLRQFLRLPGGLKFLLEIRAEVLTSQRSGGPHLGPLDQDLEDLFEAWFQEGFLYLQEITLDSPYRQIEIIMNGDLVHPMTRLEEMGRRLGRDRRCFALYHRAMPEEPVVFIEVALTDGLVRSIHDILGSEKEPEEAPKDTAIFYSINNTQNGLSGLGMGNLLIFQVVDFLQRENPDIKNFCTLSPMPGFWRRFLLPVAEGRSEGLKTKKEDLLKIFDKKSRDLLKAENAAQGGSIEEPLAEAVRKVFANPKWAANEVLVDSLAKPLSRLGHIYLAEEKNKGGRSLDPVANFHLTNGATLSAANINFGADWSPMGLERSMSLMVNYIYSQQWWKKIRDAARLGGILPALSKPWTGRRPTEIGTP